MSRIFNTVPTGIAEWEQHVKAANLRGATINRFIGMRSGLEITQEQFLLLRVVWPTPRTPLQFDPATYGLHQQFPQACAVLSTYPYFQNFLESIRAKAAATPHGPNDPMDLGVFELPSEAQRLIHSIATENRTGQAPGPVFQGTGGYSLPLPRPLDKGVVKWGLVMLLNALAIKTPNVNTKASPGRVALSATFRKDEYEAIMDGALLHGDSGGIQAIIEANSEVRDSLQPSLRMKESAEMVAWVMSDPREPGENLIGRYVFYQDVYLLRKQQLTDLDICLLLNMRAKYT
jgi:hypothetical protein